MDERPIADDDDTELVNRMAASNLNNHRNNKVHSYSQPLGRDATSRRSALRKHSLDEERIMASTPEVVAMGPNSSNAPRSYSYPHNHPFSPPPTAAGGAAYHHQYSVSADDARYANPHLPPPLPPHHLSSLRNAPTSSLSGSDGSVTLERAMSEYGGSLGSLSEFTGAGGGTGIFRVPTRAAIHPGRPPALELRPHPLRETQVGSFLRTIACTRTQLWAGQESGLRCWNLSDVFSFWSPSSNVTPPKRGDEDSSPFRESVRTSPTLCLAIDAAKGLIWSGHKDGKIRSWKMEQVPDPPKSQTDGSSISADDANTSSFREGETPPFREGLSWQAHRAPVLSLIITSYGDLWSGSEAGSIKAWPWESVEKSLSLTVEERHMAALLVERSYVDLRTQVTVGGVCSLPAVDIKYMLSDNSRSKVWSAGSLSFALWDARSKELLKVFGIDGQVDNRVDTPSLQEPYVEDDTKAKVVSTSKKEKSQGFFQRSRNALMGAADAVRRVAVKGTFGEDNRRTEALAIAMDGMIWTGCTNGSLVQWDGNGNRVVELHHHSHSVQSICAFGTRLWVGYVSGTIQVIDLEGNLLGGWVANSSPVIKMAVGGSYIFTLANHGGIRGWSLTSPGPLDNILRTELASKELLHTKLENLKILIGTWNVGQERASHDSLTSWLGSVASDVGLVVVGLQEVEMGAGFLAMSAAKETVGLEGSAYGQWWIDNIGKTLDATAFERVGSRQLAGLLIAAWARKSLRLHIGDVDAAAVACGFGRAIGNKGAVGLRMRVYDRIMCFVSCHFAAHLEAVSRRNADFGHVYRNLAFSRPSNVNHTGSGGASSAIQSKSGGNATASNADDGKPDLSEADMVVFFGDFNYRLHGISYDEARDMVSQRMFDWLREKDQLRAEMKSGKVFQGMREGQIKFPPTYKFDRHTVGLAGYDSSEKKRIPAWCDRILYRDTRSISVAECSLECPVVSSISQYEACMDVNDSDHKPVRCIFNVDIAHVDELTRREDFGEIIMTNEKIRSLLEDFSNVPESNVSTNNIILQNQDASVLKITNKCDKYKAAFQIICEGQSTIKEDGSSSELLPRGSFGLPHWLQVHPAAGIIKPGQVIDVTLLYEDFYTQEEFVDGIPQNWWCEDTRDKEVVLIVNVMGSYSTENRSHRIHVRHCLSGKTSSAEPKPSSKRKPAQSNHKQNSNYDSFGDSSDVMRDLWQMRCP